MRQTNDAHGMAHLWPPDAQKPCSRWTLKTETQQFVCVMCLLRWLLSKMFAPAFPGVTQILG
jgi:hypothetical protein